MLLAIAAFMAAQFGIGVWVSRRIATEDDYLVAGRRMGPVLVTGSLFATWFGAETVVGAAGSAWADGVSIASAEPFAYGLCIILMGVVFARALWSKQLTTLADLYRTRYGVAVERVAAVLLIPTSLLWAAAQVRAFGQVLISSGAGVELELALLIAAGFVIAYTAVGGLLADATTDVVQAVIVTAGMVLLLVAITSAAGGPGAAASLVADGNRLSVLPESGTSVLETIEAWAIPVLGSVVATELVSRVIGARSPNVAQYSAFAAGGAYIVVGCVAVLIGLVAGPLIGAIDDPEQLVHTAARAYLAPWAYVVFAGAFLSAILSTVDSTLLVAAGLFSHNLLLPVLPRATERDKVRITRGAVAVFGVVAYALSHNEAGITALVEQASAFGSAGILVTLCFGLFTRIGGARAAIASLLAGGGVYVAATVAGLPAPYLTSLAAALAAYVLLASY